MSKMNQKCTHCGQDYKPGQVCSVQKKQDGNELCEVETVRQVASAPERVKRNLMCAEFVFPEYSWGVSIIGVVTGLLEADPTQGIFFDLSNPRDCEKVLFKLKELGWTLKERRSGGKPLYEFIKHRQINDAGIAESSERQSHQNLEILIGQVVRKVMEKKT